MPRILLITTGGTIASTRSGTDGPVTARLAGESLMAGVALPAGIEITLLSLPAKASGALSLNDLQDFARMIESELPEHDGVVMTHGTDTMEETAWGLELLLAPTKPVVLTGAQRHADEADGDGPRNLREAILVAAEPALGAAGVVILFEGDIHPARSVRKTHTSRVDTFRSGDFGKIGFIDADRVYLQRLPVRAPALGLNAPPAEVALVQAAMGMGPGVLDWLASQDEVAAVVVVGFGRGNLPDGWRAAAKRLIDAGKPVVMASRCPEGRVMPIYGNESGGASLATAGVRFGGDLSALKLRILLAFGLGSDRESCDRLLQTWAG